MSPEDRVRLRHMIEAAETAADFGAGKTRDELESDRKTLFAIIRCVEIIGEAAGRLSAETKRLAPDVPWTAMVGMRNRLVHAYFDVDVDVVWKTLNTEFPALVDKLRRMV